MATMKQFVLVFIFVVITICLGSPNKTKKTTILNKATDLITSAASDISGKSVTSLGKAMASTAVGFYMSQVESGLSIAILNSMQDRFLMNPKLFLVNGKTIGPPVLMIPPRATDQSEAKLLFLEEHPQGIICYELLKPGEQANLKLVCLYFYVFKKNEFTFTTSDDLNILEEKSIEQVLKTLTSDKTIGENVVFSPTGLQIDAIAQMTTGKNARLFLEIKDSFKSFQSTAVKRELVSSLAVGLAVGAASALATAVKKYLTTPYGTILTLENISNKEDPFLLYDPIWYKDEQIRVQNIIPWRLETGKSHDIVLTSKKKLFDTPVFVLSFKVNENQDNSRRLVLTIWWPSLVNGKSYGCDEDSDKEDGTISHTDGVGNTGDTDELGKDCNTNKVCDVGDVGDTGDISNVGDSGEAGESGNGSTDSDGENEDGDRGRSRDSNKDRGRGRGRFMGRVNTRGRGNGRDSQNCGSGTLL